MAVKAILGVISFHLQYGSCGEVLLQGARADMKGRVNFDRLRTLAERCVKSTAHSRHTSTLIDLLRASAPEASRSGKIHMTLGTLLTDIGLTSAEVRQVATGADDRTLGGIFEWILQAPVNSLVSEASTLVICLSIAVLTLTGHAESIDPRGITRDPYLILGFVGPAHTAELVSSDEFESYLLTITDAVKVPDWWTPTAEWLCLPALTTFHEFVRAVLVIGQDVEPSEDGLGWGAFLESVHFAVQSQSKSVASAWLGQAGRADQIRAALQCRPRF
jgi:hypothetical protein